MYRTIGALVLALAVTSGPALAQQPGEGRAGPPPQAQGYQQMERQQDRIREMERLMERIHETNRWMTQQHARDNFQEMGEHMAETGDRIGQMQHQLDQARGAADRDRDRDRIQDMDQLQDRLHDMARDLDRAHDALRRTIGQP